MARRRGLASAFGGIIDISTDQLIETMCVPELHRGEDRQVDALAEHLSISPSHDDGGPDGETNGEIEHA